MFVVQVRVKKGQYVLVTESAESEEEAASLAKQRYRQRVEIAWVGPDLAFAFDQMLDELVILEKKHQKAIQESNGFDYRHHSGVIYGIKFALRLLGKRDFQ